MNVPKLRFSGFNNSYITERLNKLVAIYDGTHETPNYTSSGVKFVSVENINNLLHSDKYISLEDFDKYKIKPKYDDIFMTRIGDIGTSTIYKSNDNLAYYVSLALLRTKNQLILYPDYLNQYIKSSYFQKELYKRTIHVAFPKKINTGEIGECDITIPEYIEQKKISKFLSILDKKIELQSRKVDALKLFKLCILKHIFSSATVKTKLKNVSSITKGEQINSEELSKSGSYYMLNGGTEPSGYLEKYNTLENTITISEGGNSCGYVKYNKYKFWCGGHCYSIKNKLIDNHYLYQLLKFNEKKIMRLRIGSGLPNIQKKDLENFELFIHKKNNQYKIANLLMKYDTKIELEKNKLDKLTSLKTGLLQNMFI